MALVAPVHQLVRTPVKRIVEIPLFLIPAFASAFLLISPTEFDFGERTEIERPVLTATLRNDGDRTVRVTDVIRTCVCADLKLSTTNLPPAVQPRSVARATRMYPPNKFRNRRMVQLRTKKSHADEN